MTGSGWTSNVYDLLDKFCIGGHRHPDLKPRTPKYPDQLRDYHCPNEGADRFLRSLRSDDPYWESDDRGFAKSGYVSGTTFNQFLEGPPQWNSTKPWDPFKVIDECFRYSACGEVPVNFYDGGYTRHHYSRKVIYNFMQHRQTNPDHMPDGLNCPCKGYQNLNEWGRKIHDYTGDTLSEVIPGGCFTVRFTYQAWDKAMYFWNSLDSVTSMPSPVTDSNFEIEGVCKRSQFEISLKCRDSPLLLNEDHCVCGKKATGSAICMKGEFCSEGVCSEAPFCPDGEPYDGVDPSDRLRNENVCACGGTFCSENEVCNQEYGICTNLKHGFCKQMNPGSQQLPFSNLTLATLDGTKTTFEACEGPCSEDKTAVLFQDARGSSCKIAKRTFVTKRTETTGEKN